MTEFFLVDTRGIWKNEGEIEECKGKRIQENGLEKDAIKEPVRKMELV